MNKIFKVIWNRTTQSLVVTSELAKGVAKASCDTQGKSKSSLGKIFKLSALSLLLLDVTGIAYAATPEGTGNGQNEAIALGSRSSAAPGAVVIGAGSTATGNIKGIAIGHTVMANGQDAVAIGSNSNAQTQSVAVGRLANAAANGVAVGNTAIVREAPEKIKNVYLCNTYDKKDNPTFFNFIGRTNLVKNGVMTVEGRYQMPDFLTRYVDIVLSHQWENGLNYAYNDALYGGYPFIHNSKLIPKGVGYYYDQFDAFEGAKVLLDVIDNHDKHHEEYVKRANEYLDSQLPTNPVNIYLYEKEIKRLFS